MILPSNVAAGRSSVRRLGRPIGLAQPHRYWNPSMIGYLLRPELEELIRAKNWDVLRECLSEFHPSDIAEILIDIPDDDDVPIFRILPRDLAGEVFAYLPHHHQEMLVRSISNEQMRTLLNE